MQIKNIDSVSHVWAGMTIESNATYTIPTLTEELAFANDSNFITALSTSKAQVIDAGVVVSDIATAIGMLRKDINKVEVTSTPPFAEPLYRTKRDGTSQWHTCPSNTATIIDYQLTAERYVTGGEIIFKNAKEGDYITAQIYDKDSIIPSPYRAALCENWPDVATYLIKKWLKPTETDKYDSFMIDTYPLNAKISAGLYLRVTYHASTEASDRKIAVNYHLTKKL